MKKLKLNSTAFAGAELLSRTQLKNVMGGVHAPGGGGGSCFNDSQCPGGFCNGGNCSTFDDTCGPAQYDTPTTWTCCGSFSSSGTCRDLVASCNGGIFTNDQSRCNPS